MIIEGYATKAAISAGEMTSIKSWYPDFASNAENGDIALGAGVMTIMPVMGTALTKAHKLISKQRGAVLIVDAELANLSLQEGIELIKLSDDASCINWISSKLPLSDQIAEKSGLNSASTEKLNIYLESYFKVEPCPLNDWIEATRKNLDMNTKN